MTRHHGPEPGPVLVAWLMAPGCSRPREAIPGDKLPPIHQVCKQKGDSWTTPGCGCCACCDEQECGCYGCSVGKDIGMPSSPGLSVVTQATQYTVTAAPPEVNEAWAGSFTITVEWRAQNQWAVLLRGSWCLGVDGEWDYETIPSERTDEWKKRHRFDLATALRLAEQAAPTVTVGRLTIHDAIERCGDGKP